MINRYVIHANLSIALLFPLISEGSDKLSVVNGVNIPAIFRDVLSNGMPVPIQVKYLNDNSGYSVDYLATATIQLLENELQISYIEINDSTIFTEKYMSQLRDVKDLKFDEIGVIELNNGSIITLDLSRLLIVLNVPQDAFAMQAESRQGTIGSSSVDHWSSIATYNFGLSGNRINEGLNQNNVSNYLNINTISGINEHHIYFDNSFYGIGSDNYDSKLRRLMYEKDYNGRRFSFGILSGWDLQSLGQVSALNADRIWGVSIGNQSRSSYVDNSRSFTPLFVFLPAAGEVRIYKDTRLISIQNFSMGNKEIETSAFPSGIYDVLVEVIVNGQVVSKTTQRVDKYSFSNISNSTQWQLWGGFMEPSQTYRNDKQVLNKTSYLVGLSGAKRYKQSTFSGSAYSFGDVGVGEARINTSISDRLSLSSQLLLATDDSWRFMNGINYHIGLGSVWASHEKGYFGQMINRSDSDTYSFGSNLQLNQIISQLGTLSFSQRHNKIYNSDSVTVDYYQSLYSGHNGSLNLRLGYNENKTEDFSTYDKNVSLELSIPLSRKFTAGVTKNKDGATVANLEYQQIFKDNPIRSVGFNLNKNIESGDNSNGNNKINSSGYVNYATDYIQGTVMANRSSSGDWNANMTANGNIGITPTDVVASSTSSREAGVIVKTGMNSDKSIVGTINGREYKLSGDKTFITLDGYQEYNLVLHNSKESRDSFEMAEYKRDFTLYPGNIYTHDIRSSIREMVTVFGILKDEYGQYLSNVRLNNHIGSTITDYRGEFVIDVDKQFPIVSSVNIGGMVCEAEFDLSAVRGATWVDEIICYESKVNAQL